MIFPKEVKQLPHRTWESQICDEFSSNTSDGLDEFTEADFDTEAGSEDELRSNIKKDDFEINRRLRSKKSRENKSISIKAPGSFGYR